MRRRAWLVSVAVIVSCGGTAQEEFAYPSTLGDGWKLEGTARLTADETPDEIRRLGLRSAYRGRYAGAGDLTVTVYWMTSEAGAFELAQKWRPEAGRLAYHQGDLFVVLESAGMDHRSLAGVAEQIERSLKESR
ncbi:MAG: hypothetical protein KIT09_18650 [Bryobacteraceae bacterium]|nr:hypothetical protein [Bryobacteraceae bacterium]